MAGAAGTKTQRSPIRSKRRSYRNARRQSHTRWGSHSKRIDSARSRELRCAGRKMSNSVDNRGFRVRHKHAGDGITGKICLLAALVLLFSAAAGAQETGKI